MRHLILSIGLAVAAFAFVLQLPMVSSMGQLAAVWGVNSTGTRLGQTVHDVVLNIRAQDKARGSEPIITHAHVMAVMCQENPKLNISIVNGEGRQEGLTQVIPSTARGLLSGQMAKGGCAYVGKLEKGICADPAARISNPRCSIELGSCLFNYELKRCRGNVICAYNAYNTGTPRKRANGLDDFVRGYVASASGQLCAKSKSNLPVWQAMLAKISQLTNGQFKTEGFQQIMTSVAGWPTSPDSIPTVKNIGDMWRKSSSNTTNPRSTYKSPATTTQGSTSSNPSSNPSLTPNQAGESTIGKDRASWLDKLLGNDLKDAVAPKATLACQQVGSKVQLRWSCPSGTTISRGLSTTGAKFDTRGAGAGAMSITGSPGAEYKVQCLKGHQLYAVAKCKPSQSTSVSSVSSIGSTPRDVIPPGVVMSIEYDDGNVIWATLGTRECRLTAGSLRKMGQDGNLPIGVLTESMLIKLECNTSKGKAVKHKQIVVE